MTDNFKEIGSLFGRNALAADARATRHSKTYTAASSRMPWKAVTT